MHNRSFAAGAIYPIVRLYILWQRVGSSIPVNVMGFVANLGVLLLLTKEKQKDPKEEELFRY